MGKEIERKFLVSGTEYRQMALTTSRVIQGYLSKNPDATVRVRVRDGKGYLTVKSRNKGMVRNEWEYEIPAADAASMLSLADGAVIDKTRYVVYYEGWRWEVDEFHGANEGLVVAEVELPNENAEPAIPPFVSTEVTGDPRYYNSNL